MAPTLIRRTVPRRPGPYLPSRIGTASGVTLGLTVSIGGLISPLLGHLADSTSLKTALTPP